MKHCVLYLAMLAVVLIGGVAANAATADSVRAEGIAKSAQEALEAHDALHAEVTTVLKSLQSPELSSKLAAAMAKGSRTQAVRVIKEAGAKGTVRINSISRRVIVIVICHGDHCHIIVIRD